jgi:hypothetical protein
LDQQLGLGRSELSPAAEQVVSYVGAFMPFEIAADFLVSQGILAISHDTVNNTTVRIGDMLRQQQDAEAEAIWSEQQPYPNSQVGSPPDTLYLSADGVRYLTPDGSGRELKVAVVYETEMRDSETGNPEPRTVRPIYLVSSQPPQTFAKLLDVKAQQRGVDQANRTVVLQDGQGWLWDHIPPVAGSKRVEIIDFYHAAGYITDAIDALMPPAERPFWKHVLLDHLKTVPDGCEHLMAVLQLLAPPEPPSAVQETLTYFSNHTARMDYADYLQQGLQIGSGTIESGAKRLVSDRLKQAGMRWNPAHAEAVAQVRAAIFSQRWRPFWRSYQPPPRPYRRSHALQNAA